jgi:hypothetical protein
MKTKIVLAGILAFATCCLMKQISTNPGEPEGPSTSGRTGVHPLIDGPRLRSGLSEKTSSPVSFALPRPPGQPPSVAQARPAGASLDPRDRTGLLSALDHGDSRARRWAVFHLVNGFPVDGEVIARLLDLLADSEDPDLLSLALWGLGQSSDPSVTGAVGHAALEISNPEVRLAAVEALGSLGGNGASGPLERVLQIDTATEVRTQAAVVLGLTYSEDVSVVQTLARTSMSDPSSSVRAAAIDALAVSSSEVAVAALEQVATESVHSGERQRAAEILETRSVIDSADGSDLTALTREPQDPLVASAQVNY